MLCENTTFAYDNEFKNYIKVDGVVSEDIFNYFFDVGAEKFLKKKRKNISLNYWKNGIQSILSKLILVMMV